MQFIKKIFSALLLLFSIGSCAQKPIPPHPATINPDFDKKISSLINFSVPVIGVHELHGRLDEIYLLDAREPEEYAVSHLPGARLTGYKNLQKEALKDIPKDAPVVVYCSVGYRSEKIGEQLQKMGFTNVSNLYGSLFEWVNAGYSIEDTQGNKTNKVHTYNRRWSQWVEDDKAKKVW